MTTRVPDEHFEGMYAHSNDPWGLAHSWYEHRRHAIILALLPYQHYRHAFEPGCSVGVLTERLTYRCHRVTATDVATAALDGASRRLRAGGRREQVTLVRRSIDETWPPGPFDLVVLSEVCYYLHADMLRAVLDRECPRLAPGATVIASHWRHPMPDYPMSGDHANDIVAATPGLHMIGSYRDADVAIEVFDTATADSVADRSRVPGTSQ
ncbi:SAM-dependent methyltransferase [Mycobacterium sp.]|jgi:SAM-dependent methyltransferase|uniref:SAM-dependent methyltransferase n=1 Tax=Mycobacterium sp. TaxID=1785 RepID=UPI002D6F2683|nr:SAM-dependent methyltransferase [Mycobacterium sp.]HZA09487.1 SAM-dependent methyltransferase [Mycobacterium sp.]